MTTPNRHLPRWIAGLLLVVILLVPRPATAQAAPPHDDVLSLNPFLALFEWLNAEWEHRLQPTRTLGLAASFISLDDGDDEYTTVAGFFRYFPQERAPGGFFFGPRAGMHRIQDSAGDSETALGVGLELGYTWLLGSTESFAISLGGGATRLFGTETDVRVVIPTLRLVNIGWAF